VTTAALKSMTTINTAVSILLLFLSPPLAVVILLPLRLIIAFV